MRPTQPGATSAPLRREPGGFSASNQPLRALIVLAYQVQSLQIVGARTLTGQVQRPVVDRTGLMGEWDFDLQFLPARFALNAATLESPSIFSALQEQRAQARGNDRSW